MKGLLEIACFGLLVSVASAQVGEVKVDGYWKNGRWVEVHRRTAPDETRRNNWSTYPNTNPYTGKRGTKRVYGDMDAFNGRSSPDRQGGIRIDYTPTRALGELAARAGQAEARNRNMNRAAQQAGGRPVIFADMGGQQEFVSPHTHPHLYRPAPGIVINTPQHVRAARKAAEREAKAQRLSADLNVLKKSGR